MLSLIAAVSQAALGVLLVVAGITKLAAPRAFVRAVRRFELLPPALATAVGVALPGIEVLAGLLLLTSAWRPLGLVLCIALLATFSVAVAIKLAQGRLVPCHCFSGA